MNPQIDDLESEPRSPMAEPEFTMKPPQSRTASMEEEKSRNERGNQRTRVNILRERLLSQLEVDPFNCSRVLFLRFSDALREIVNEQSCGPREPSPRAFSVD